MSPFDFINCLTGYKKKWEDLSSDEQNKMNTFMINRIISMDPDHIEFVNEVQKYSNLPNYLVYKLYLDVLPNRRLKGKYIKKNQEKINDDMITIISQHFELSKKDAIEINNSWSKEEKELFLFSLGIEDKEIKKLVK